MLQLVMLMQYQTRHNVNCELFTCYLSLPVENNELHAKQNITFRLQDYNNLL